ncbi:DUF4377 domain-containing protein [Gallaecimonas xiamenensis]|uniref:DUF4377 domain-containing protein n=1 Tax=Gallaecimonas xiamenensis 3-C-1 TaxID=745411 RepID=K2K1C0_9GAMM|nr:DUF4377 domain-containing protein [Gallaecimonas xiamenensis]EKE76599.1 hypothetical protein B3C1_03360 [Gallaecimonas xiamenensis 3-C-1]
MKKTLMLPLCAVALWGCGQEGKAPMTDGELMTLEVGPQQVDCVGVGPRKCLVVDGEAFYSDIAGFDFEAGFDYRLKVKRTEAFPKGQVPADASPYRYELMAVLDKTPAQ